jgi:hypothetical protein
MIVILNIIMLSVIMVNVVMLSVIMVNVVMLSVIMVNVVAPVLLDSNPRHLDDKSNVRPQC